jgi:hypothetical protein
VSAEPGRRHPSTTEESAIDAHLDGEKLNRGAGVQVVSPSCSEENTASACQGESWSRRALEKRIANLLFPASLDCGQASVSSHIGSHGKWLCSKAALLLREHFVDDSINELLDGAVASSSFASKLLAALEPWCASKSEVTAALRDRERMLLQDRTIEGGAARVVLDKFQARITEGYTTSFDALVGDKECQVVGEQVYLLVSSLLPPSGFRTLAGDVVGMLLTLPLDDVRDVLADHRWRYFCIVRALETLWREGHASVRCTMATALVTLAQPPVHSCCFLKSQEWKHFCALTAARTLWRAGHPGARRAGCG